MQLAYAIGVAEPISIFVNSYSTSHVGLSDSEIAARIQQLFDLRPYAIEQRLQLRKPIYQATASYGHFGREPRHVTRTVNNYDGSTLSLDVELFTWERLDYVDQVREAFGIQA